MNIRLFALLFLGGTLPITANAENYKCIINGYQSYQDHQCPDETSAKIVEIKPAEGKVQQKALHQAKRPKKKAYFVSGKSEVTFSKPDK